MKSLLGLLMCVPLVAMADVSADFKKLFGGKSVITRETARTAQQKVYYSSEKFQKAFPEFRFTPLADTVQEMAGAYRA